MTRLQCCIANCQKWKVFIRNQPCYFELHRQSSHWTNFLPVFAVILEQVDSFFSRTIRLPLSSVTNYLLTLIRLGDDKFFWFQQFTLAFDLLFSLVCHFIFVALYMHNFCLYTWIMWGFIGKGTETRKSKQAKKKKGMQRPICWKCIKLWLGGAVGGVLFISSSLLSYQLSGTK